MTKKDFEEVLQEVRNEAVEGIAADLVKGVSAPKVFKDKAVSYIADLCTDCFNSGFMAAMDAFEVDFEDEE